MKFAIIAAGEGSRLASEGIAQPKPLVSVGGERLIDRLIRIFMDNGAEEIVAICNDRTALVSEHLTRLQTEGLGGRPVPLRFVVRSTPSSMHSFYEISQYLEGGAFVLTTVDTVFSEGEFRSFVEALGRCEADGLMGVTSYVDDEKPLWVETAPTPPGLPEGEGGLHGLLFPVITGFYDARPPSVADGGGVAFVSAGIYGLREQALETLRGCVARGERRMRNFQRALIADGRRLLAYPFTKVIDIDHASDIVKAEEVVYG